MKKGGKKKTCWKIIVGGSRFREKNCDHTINPPIYGVKKMIDYEKLVLEDS
jgi:hypothetical protein